MKPHVVKAEHARKALEWIKDRGGIAVWESVNLANPGATWSAPVNGPEGKPAGKPTWEAGNEPVRIITDASEVSVTVPKIVRRFRIATRVGGNGLSIKLTDASSRKVREMLAKYRTDERASWYEFDYSTQECLIFVDDRVVPLLDFISESDCKTTNA